MSPRQAGLPQSSQPPSRGGFHTFVFGRNPRRTAIRIVILVVTCFVLVNYVLIPIRVDGISMQPTYRDRSINLANRLAYLWHEPRRGDVVSIRFNPEADASEPVPHLMLMKRIISLPGETVQFIDGRVMIDGNVLVEPYEKTTCDWNSPPVKLGSSEYFVVGDNRTMPEEDHQHGVAQRRQIVGRLLW